jgi:FkbM family methyltransferase
MTCEGSSKRDNKNSEYFRTYSQYGEDKIIHRIFGEKYLGVCIEVGAFDGRTGSNTLAFEEIGWKTILVEPNPLLAEKIRNERPAATLFECAVGAECGEVQLAIPLGAETLASVSRDPSQISRMECSGEAVDRITVPQRTIDEIISEAGVDKIDFITIDVEGYELEALKGFDISRWHPRIVILEDNSSGTSLEIPTWMARYGYVRCRSSGCNDWYCDASGPLATRRSIILTEFIKSLKAYKKITLSALRRAFG